MRRRELGAATCEERHCARLPAHFRLAVRAKWRSAYLEYCENANVPAKLKGRREFFKNNARPFNTIAGD